MTAIMAALYFHALGPNDRVAVKPHAGPVLHAIHYLLGSQSLDQLQNFRGFGGMQSYPSRTKDQIPVDFSTGSVGLGVAITAFASLVQDYLIAHGKMAEEDRGRFVALIGDAELDEGNIYECLIEAYKHDIRNCWWIVDYNRQSLDATTADRMFDRFDEIFATCGWRTVELRYGKRLARGVGQASGRSRLARRPAQCRLRAPCFTRAARRGGRGSTPIWARRARRSSKGLDDEALGALMTNLGGHCMETLIGGVRRGDGRCARPCSSPGRSRASACPSPATRTIIRA